MRPRAQVTYYLIASPAGAVLPRRREAGVDLAQRGLHPRGARRHGRGEDRRQLRRVACSRRPRRTSTAATRSRSSTRRAQVRRGARRHERVFVFDDGTLVTPESPARSSRASRATRSCSSPTTAATRSTERRVSIDEWRDGVRLRRHRRGVRLRHRRRGHPGRLLKWKDGDDPDRRRRRRPGHRGRPQRAARHPVRPRGDPHGWMTRISLSSVTQEPGSTPRSSDVSRGAGLEPTDGVDDGQQEPESEREDRRPGPARCSVCRPSPGFSSMITIVSTSPAYGQTKPAILVGVASATSTRTTYAMNSRLAAPPRIGRRGPCRIRCPR